MAVNFEKMLCGTLILCFLRAFGVGVKVGAVLLLLLLVFVGCLFFVVCDLWFVVLSRCCDCGC